MTNILDTCKSLLAEVRRQSPLVHHITNYVTVNDCANITLAIGASPVMADAEEEVADIAAISRALVLNMGTLNPRTVRAMLLAGRAANQKGIPVIFDPVGAGASPYRNATAEKILKEINIAVLRGNISEISFLAGEAAQTKGVDASASDIESGRAREIAVFMAKKYNCVAVITGATDVISNGKRTALITNGAPEMNSVSGTGCMSASLIASFCGVTQDYYSAAAAGILCMGTAGELAAAHAAGLGSLRTGIIDQISKLTPAVLQEKGKINETHN